MVLTGHMPSEKEREEVEALHRLAQHETEILRMVEADKKARWLWALARSIAIWVTAVTVGIAAFKNFISDMLGRH